MANIYVVNHGGHNYAAAERFGRLVICTRGHIPKWDINEMYRRASEVLRDSSPDDYILLTSLTSLCSVYCAIFAHMHGRLNLLIYKDGDYVERTIVLEEELEDAPVK